MQLVSSAALCAALACLANCVRVVKKAHERQLYQTKCTWANGVEKLNQTYGPSGCGSNTSAPGCNQMWMYDLLTTTAAKAPQGAPVPLAVFVHGGSWRGGDKSTGLYQQEFTALRQRGMHVASINYRLTPEVTFPQHSEDVEAALIYFRSEQFVEDCPECNIDPAKIFLMGSSAGGQLVSLVGTNQRLGPKARPAAVVDFYGPVVLYWGSAGRSSIPDMLGCDTPEDVGSDCHGTAKSASADTWVTAESPPFLIFQGKSDVSLLASQALKDAGDKAGANFTLVEVTCKPGLKCHSRDAMFQATTRGVCNVDVMYAWLYEKLNWHATGCTPCPFFEG